MIWWVGHGLGPPAHQRAGRSIWWHTGTGTHTSTATGPRVGTPQHPAPARTPGRPPAHGWAHPAHPRAGGRGSRKFSRHPAHPPGKPPAQGWATSTPAGRAFNLVAHGLRSRKFGSVNSGARSAAVGGHVSLPRVPCHTEKMRGIFPPSISLPRVQCRHGRNFSLVSSASGAWPENLGHVGWDEKNPAQGPGCNPAMCAGPLREEKRGALPLGCDHTGPPATGTSASASASHSTATGPRVGTRAPARTPGRPLAQGQARQHRHGHGRAVRRSGGTRAPARPRHGHRLRGRRTPTATANPVWRGASGLFFRGLAP